MKVLFITNVPSPYRVSFFNELGKHCTLTVCFERHSASDRDAKWVNSDDKYFREIYADVTPIGTDQSKGDGIVKVIKQEQFDHLIIAGYASPSVMRAIVYCRLHKIPYYIESDGAFFVKDSFPKGIIKKYLLCGAKAHFTTCEEHIRYLNSLGVSKSKIYKYPFSSVKDSDILDKVPTQEEKFNFKKAIGITEEKMVLSVGQFIHRKGYDVLLDACQGIDKSIGVYIVGGEPTDAYIAMKEKYNLTNVHFVSFMSKDELKKWYLAADCFVLPTREDIWGLVINEAMAYGLPVITTNRCNAGLEMVEDGKSGYIINSDDSDSLRNRIEALMSDIIAHEAFCRRSLDVIQYYTLEKMVQVHMRQLSD